METIELRLTIDKEAVEAIMTLLGALADRMSDKRESREESTKEESKEKTTYHDIRPVINSLSTCMNMSKPCNNTNPQGNNNTIHQDNTATTDNKDNNNINNNTLSVDVDEKAINKVNEKAYSNVDKAMDTMYKAVPTLEDVEEYVSKCGYKMSAQKFYDYYKDKDWKTKNGVSIVGKWKGFVDNWAKSEFIQTMKPSAATATIEERHAAHPFVPTQFTEDGKLA